MKKFLLVMFAMAIAASSCTKGGDDDDYGGGTNRGERYEIGSLYDVNGKKGVVFEVSSNGKHGKILSLNRSGNSMLWDDAKAWCKGQGEGWYLPSLDELWTVYRCKVKLNKTLENVKSSNPIESYYLWSSSSYEYDDNLYYFFDMTNSYTTYGDPQNCYNYTRAVCEF